MGEFYIWHWIVVLGVLGIIFVIPIIAVLRENSDRTISRRQYLKWVGLYWGVLMVLQILAAILIWYAPWLSAQRWFGLSEHVAGVF